MQQQEGLGVAGDDIHQPAPLIGGQRLAGGGLAHELQRRFQLTGVLLKALAVEGVAAGEVFLEGPGGPLAKMHALAGFHPITNGDDEVKIVVVHLVGFSVRASLCKFCTNCLGLQFVFRENIADVLGKDRAFAPEEFGQLVLVEPDRLLSQPDLDTPAGGLVNNDVSHFSSLKKGTRRFAHARPGGP